MRVWSLRAAALGGCLLAGCGSKPPAPVANPNATPPVITEAPVVEETKPAEPPAPTQPAAAQPAPMPATKNAVAQDDPLRDIAAKLVQPTDGGGWRIDEAAALELERLEKDAPVKLLPLLTDDKVEVRRGAAYHLLSMFNADAADQVRAFTALLGDNDAMVRGIGLQAVRQMHAPDIAQATAGLVAMLDPAKETKAENRAAIARLAGGLMGKGEGFAAGLAKSAVSDPEERVRSAALFALTQVATDQSMSTLKQAMADKQASVRLVAAGRLRNLGSKAEPATSELVTALGDEDERVRVAAAEAIVRIGPSAATKLSAALTSGNADARKLSLACLSGLGDAAKEVLPAIEKAQGDKDKDVAEAAKILVSRLK